MFKREIRLPIWAYISMSLGGLLLHLRIHPPMHGVLDAIPTLCGLVTTFTLPFMFNKEKTVAQAYLINLVIVAVGTIGMLYHSATHWEVAVNLKTLILQSTLVDILILAAKLPLAHIILRYWRPVEIPTAGESNADG